MIKLSPSESVAMFLGALVKQAKTDYVFYRRTVLSAGWREAKSAKAFIYGIVDGSLDGLAKALMLVGLDAESVKDNCAGARLLEERRARRRRLKYQRDWVKLKRARASTV